MPSLRVVAVGLALALASNLAHAAEPVDEPEPLGGADDDVPDPEALPEPEDEEAAFEGAARRARTQANPRRSSPADHATAPQTRRRPRRAPRRRSSG